MMSAMVTNAGLNERTEQQPGRNLQSAVVAEWNTSCPLRQVEKAGHNVCERSSSDLPAGRFSTRAL